MGARSDEGGGCIAKWRYRIPDRQQMIPLKAMKKAAETGEWKNGVPDDDKTKGRSFKIRSQISGQVENIVAHVTPA